MRKILYILLLLSNILIAEHRSAEELKKECEINGINYLNAIEFTKYLQNFLEKNDADQVIKLISYPLRVNYELKEKGKAKLLHKYIGNEAQLYAIYPQIFNKKMVEKILSYSPDDIFCNSYGAMLGDGILWYVPDTSADFYQLRISTVNMI